MWIYDKGNYRQMTEIEEEKQRITEMELSKLHKPEPSPDERIAALEQKITGIPELKTHMDAQFKKLFDLIGGLNGRG